MDAAIVSALSELDGSFKRKTKQKMATTVGNNVSPSSQLALARVRLNTTLHIGYASQDGDTQLTLFPTTTAINAIDRMFYV